MNAVLSHFGAGRDSSSVLVEDFYTPFYPLRFGSRQARSGRRGCGLLEGVVAGGEAAGVEDFSGGG